MAADRTRALRHTGMWRRMHAECGTGRDSKRSLKPRCEKGCGGAKTARPSLRNERSRSGAGAGNQSGFPAPADHRGNERPQASGAHCNRIRA